MSRTALTNLKSTVIVALALAVGGGLGGWAYIANSPSHQARTLSNAQHQTTQISYQGQNGVDALTLLKRHATVQTKHYSFGDLVTAINGSAAKGSKYWTFYVNGKPASVGAGAYTTKSSDVIAWKLQ